MVAARRRARGWLRRLARAPLPACAALSLALALSRSPLHGGRSCSARPPGAHTLAHGHTLTPARAPSQRRRCSPHPVCRRREPLAGLGGEAREGGRRGDDAGRAERAWRPLARKLGACMGGRERVLRGTGASPPLSRRSSARPPPLSGAGGAGTWAGAIPRPKNNGRELGRGRGEAAPQRLPGRGSGVTPRGKMRGTEAAGVGRHGIWVPGEPVCKAGEASPEERWRIRPSLIIGIQKVGARDVWRPEALTEALCCPQGVQGHWAELSGSSRLKMGGMNLRSCSQPFPFIVLRLLKVLASHP